ncbi:MAG: uroporphyrinogen decarboxylase family protein, partial [Clostridia bacterium]|nr:uroporphyrinogen decarboxylase family protein [Clostridia bacterium]
PEDYARIAKDGWNNWYNRYLMSIQKPPMTKDFQLILRFIKLGSFAGKFCKYLAKRDIAPVYHTACAPAFDILSMVRSMAEFACDLIDDPGPIMDAVNRATPEIIAGTVQNVKRAKGDKAGIFAMRSSQSFISPAMFEEYAWPTLRQIIEELYKQGVRSVLHADGNWLPVMPFFRQLPKGCLHIELDGMTDIFKAYEALDGWQSLRGDVPATMLAFGTTDEVAAYSERLVTELGMRGGFMLGSGCEVPLNAKVENVRAMMAAVQ